MKGIFKHILLGLLIPLAFVSCTEKDLSTSSLPDGLAQIELGVRIPAPVLTRAMSDNENAVVENETTGFVVFAFDSNSSLVWMLKSGDTNYESNLSSYSGTTAIKWRTGVFPPGYEVTGDDAQYGTLFMEAPVSSEDLELLVVANVGLSSVSTTVADGVISSYTLGTTVLTPSSSSLEDVETALAELDYSASTLTGTWGPVTDVWDDDGNENEGLMGEETSNYIPMAGLATLSAGGGSNLTGMVSLRRSLAKVSVTVEFSGADLAKFLPMEMKIVNVNDLASVYAPADENGEQVSNIPASSTTYTAMTFYESFPSSVSATDALSVSAQLYVPESVTWPTEGDRDTHLCVLLGGVFDSDGVYTFDANGVGALNDYSNWQEENPEWASPLIWYRLDFIPSDATSTEDELTEILRNHHYRFTVSNLAYLGSYSEESAMDMLYPDNYVITDSGDGSWTLVVEDEDINSITVAYESASDGAEVGVNDYVGVSGVDLTIELPAASSSFTGNEATHLKMVTNYAEWTPSSGIDLGDCAGVFSFSFTEDDEVNENVYWYNNDTGEQQYPAHSGYLWIWADGQSGSMESASAADAKASASASLYSNGVLNVGKSYTFYICVGVVRKEIHVILAQE